MLMIFFIMVLNSSDISTGVLVLTGILIYFVLVLFCLWIRQCIRYKELCFCPKIFPCSAYLNNCFCITQGIRWCAKKCQCWRCYKPSNSNSMINFEFVKPDCNELNCFFCRWYKLKTVVLVNKNYTLWITKLLFITFNIFVKINCKVR